MNTNGRYITFCRSFHNFKIPKIKFRDYKEHYKVIFRRYYKIEQEDINKATFIIFIISFMILFLPSVTCFNLPIILILTYSFILSITLAYIFNIRLYKVVYKNETKINALLYLVKIYFSILQKSLSDDSDLALVFIKLVKGYDLPISKNFESILKRIQEGYNPEEELNNFVSPSKDFNNYLKELIANNFKTQNSFNKNDTNSLENKFKVYLKQIETRLSIIFFTGLFTPLGLGFLILFNRINLYILLILIPFFFILQRILFKKFIKSDIFLLGLLNNYSKKEKKNFEDFLSFLKSFAIKLQNNISPEKALITSYFFHKDKLSQINKSLQNQINRLLSFTCSFNEMMEFLQYELKSFRYWIIIDVLKKILIENAYESSEKIYDILNFISKHKKLEKKLEIIMKGEKFKVLIFLFLLPIIMGAIGGMFPLFILIAQESPLNNPNETFVLSLMISYEFLTIFLSLLICTSISSYYFLKIINHKKITSLILISCILFILIFFLSYFNVLKLI
ncbi:MAG: hypothetical protein ACFFC1_13050 [Promethearchaeota archaeon]